MLYVALRMLFGDRLKYFSLVGGIAFAALLMTQQAGIFAGLTYQTGAPIRNTTGDFDLWVMDPQVEFSEEFKPIADTAPDRIRGVEGVAWAVPHYKGRRTARLEDGALRSVAVVGLDDATLLGGPPVMVEGSLSDLRQDEAVLIDEAELQKNMVVQQPDGTVRPLRVGDRFSINDQAVRVAGIFRKERSFFWEPVVYTTYTRALTLAPPERRLLPYVLVKVKEGHRVTDVQQRVARETGYKVLTRGEFLFLTGQYVLLKTGILINFSISVALGFVIGVLVAAQTFYNFVLDNLRHFGVLKAMGLSNGVIIGMVASQSLLVGGVGYGLGVGLASILGSVFKSVGPGAFYLPWQIPAFVGASILLVALLSGALSLWRVLSLEPAIVFRG